jgi:hypothetical protein
MSNHQFNRGLLWLAIVFALAACAPNTTSEPTSNTPENPTPMPSVTTTVDLPDLGPAPELTNEIWLNTENPLRIADLKGKVILIDFWTFG